MAATLLKELLAFEPRVVMAAMQTTMIRAQIVADAAALATAQARLAGAGSGAMSAIATSCVQSFNGLSGATVTVNSPPSQGQFLGNSNYIEIIVTVAVDTWFIPVVGGDSQPIVGARAVAGQELNPPRQVLLALDANAVPGLVVNGVTLRTNGAVWVNSQGAGVDQNGDAVNLGYANYGIQVLNGGSVYAASVGLVGGVNSPSGIQGLLAGQLPLSDPLVNLPTPTTANGVNAIYPGNGGATFATPQNVVVDIEGSVRASLSPGIYASIEVTGAGTVTFQPGIYALSGGNAAGYALNIDTNVQIIANGVMFYNTGSDYGPTAGGPDNADGNTLGNDSSATFGEVVISPSSSGGNSFTPISNAASPFAGVLLYQRRWNVSPIAVTVHNSNDVYNGTIYARWAAFTLSDPGPTFTQIIAGIVNIVSTSSATSLNLALPSPGAKANLVFLVE